MNALTETPLRPEPRAIELLGDHVAVARDWFEANEAQLRHLTATVVSVERANATLKEDLDRKDALIGTAAEELRAAREDVKHWRAEAERMNREINTPETISFIQGILREAAHQRQRWGNDHDVGKAPEDWSWLVGHLVGKSLRYHSLAVAFRELADAEPVGSGERAFLGEKARRAAEKSIHHIITAAAACANWHLNATGKDCRMAAGKDFQLDEEPEGPRPATYIEAAPGDAPSATEFF